MRILLYQGVSLVSKLIKWQTRSIYSHAAVMFSDGTVIEAWYPDGVTLSENMSTMHTSGTPVDVFELLGEIDEAKARKFALAQAGKDYDRRSIVRFITRRDEPADDEWICSELASAIYAAGGLNLLSPLIPHSHLSPRDISLSPLLEFSHQEITT